MNKLLSIVVGLAVAIGGIAVVNGVMQPALAADSCVNGTKYTDFNGSRSGNTLTVWPKKKLCKDAKVNFTSFKVLNKNYNGKPFKNNPTALPQVSAWNKTVTLKKGSSSKVSVAMPVPDPCYPYQIDAYVGPVQTKITTSAGLVGTTAIVAKLFDKTKTNCNPPVEKTIQVCRLSDKKYPVTIKESEFDSKKYSKNPEDCKPAEKTIEVCRLSDKKYPVTIKESEFDSSKYSKNPEDCKPAEKTIEVCRLSDKQYPVTIKESEFDETKYSKNPKDCEAEDKDIQVCRLSDKVYPVTIKESEFDESKYSKDPNDCKETPPVEKCEVPGKEDLPKDSPDCKETPEEKCDVPGKEHLPADSEDCVEEEAPEVDKLPETGPAEAFAGLVGAGAMATGATAYINSRKNRK